MPGEVGIPIIVPSAACKVQAPQYYCTLESGINFDKKSVQTYVVKS